MRELFNFFNLLDEIVYVADMDSYDLIYLNKMGMKLYGLEARKDYIGKKCYEVLQQRNTPCGFCTNWELCEGKFKVWQNYNPTLNKYFILKDTMRIYKGRRYRAEIAIDISAHERQKYLIDNYQKMKEIVTFGLNIAMMAKTPEASIETLLEYIGKALQAERTYIFERNSQGNDDKTYEWVASGVSSEKEALQNIPAEVCDPWYAAFNKTKIIIINDIEELQEEAPLLYHIVKSQGVKSLVVIPLYNEGHPIGFYGIHNPPRHLLHYSAEILQLLGSILHSLLRIRNMVKQLKDMSNHDQMTGFGNRRAFEEYVIHLNGPESLSIIYCDLNGLKYMNDTRGHTAGDLMITGACDCLKESFAGHQLFRLGGDEFVVLCRGLEQDDVQIRLGLLRDKLQKKDIAMSIGISWHQSCDTANFTALLNTAESLMYKEKSEFYKKNMKKEHRMVSLPFPE